MDLRRLIQIILVVWFIAVNVAILVPSYQLLFGDADSNEGRQTLPQPLRAAPTPPAVGPLDPALDIEKQKQQVEAYKQQVGTYTEQVKVYTQEVTAYTQQLAAHKAQEESKNRGNRLAVYDSVVKNSLITLIGGFATGLIAVIFANLGAGVVDNIMRIRRGLAPESLRML